MSAIVRRGSAPGRHVYDVIVIGGQLGGILSTALLAKRGLQVLHIPHDGLSEPYTHGEQKLAHAPFLLPPIKAVHAFDESLQELGLSTVVGRAIQPTPIQLLEQDQWFEISHDEKRRGPELARVYGDEAEGHDDQLRRAQNAGDPSDPFFNAKLEFPPEGFFGKWKFKRQLAKYTGLDADTPLSKDGLLIRLTPFVQYATSAAPLGRSRVLGRVLQGPMLHTGGREGLWNQLAERARELGADVLGGSESVERLVLERSTVGVRLMRGDTIFRGGMLIAGVDLEALTQLLPEKERGAAAKIALPSPRSALTFHFVVPERALPRGLGTLALVDAPGIEGNVVLLQTSAAASADQRVVSATVLAPSALRAGGEPAIKALLSTVHASLTRVMPFTRANITFESTPWLDAPHVADGRGEPHPLFDLPDASWVGLTGLQTSSPWRRVLFANRQVLPGLGFEGEVLAARRAAKMAETALHKNDPLKRKTS